MSFRIASKEALKSTFRKHRLGAVIVKGNRILAVGHNQLRPSAITKTDTLHAEAAAILKLLKERRLHDLAGASIYVTRFTKSGRIGMALPCTSCQELIRSVGISTVHYTNDTGETQSYAV